MVQKHESKTIFVHICIPNENHRGVLFHGIEVIQYQTKALVYTMNIAVSQLIVIFVFYPYYTKITLPYLCTCGYNTSVELNIVQF